MVMPLVVSAQTSMSIHVHVPLINYLSKFSYFSSLSKQHKLIQMFFVDDADQCISFFWTNCFIDVNFSLRR